MASTGQRRAKGSIPWAFSLLLHVGIVVIGFLITWTAFNTDEDEVPPVVVANWDALTYAPLSSLDPSEQPVDNPLVPHDMEFEEVDLQEHESDVDPLSLLGNEAMRRGEGQSVAPPPPKTTFFGVPSTNARRIVYVLDASGSMIASFQLVVQELERSLDALSPRQSFAVLVFPGAHGTPQDDEHWGMAPPKGKLIPATTTTKSEAIRWLDDSVIPSGGSNPIPALREALKLDPDVVFLLSHNITGSGEFEIDQGDLLAQLDRLNRFNPETGRRTTQINCIQFLDPDPLDTLKKIAEEHGGARGYKFLDRQELGFASP